jgi:uridine kinase
MTPPCCVIAIAGPTASGKTTLAHAVCNALPGQCLLLELDAYYRDLEHQNPATRAGTNFDHPEALDLPLLTAHLAALRAGRPVAVPVYDFATHTRTREFQWMVPSPIVLVVGILVLSVPSLRQHIDWGVFIDAPPALRLQRRIQRDTTARGRTEWEVRRRFAQDAEPAFQQFREEARRTAAIELEGAAPVARNRDRILARLRAQQGASVG